MRNVLETFEYRGRERSFINWPQGGGGHGGISQGSKFECTYFEEKGQNFSAAGGGAKFQYKTFERCHLCKKKESDIKKKIACYSCTIFDVTFIRNHILRRTHQLVFYRGPLPYIHSTHKIPHPTWPPPPPTYFFN